ncbi:hypothetical protein WICPIJ_007058 [Wickerhamomyces pijperi]|uniref:Uncharacterized protein n=1 Tax=Wickerhamomyces pijperi TaxID=599730 RepID=A0A9P8Q2N2_WICPI|nr:hypothetical protein WICPIJ_007058 [Wickerhamomyces pijperi]
MSRSRVKRKNSSSEDSIPEGSLILDDQTMDSTVALSGPMRAAEGIAQTLTSDEIQSIQTSITDINSLADIDTLQKKLQSDYKLLAKDFSHARLARIEAYISKIEEIQNSLKRDLEEKEALLEDDLPTVDPAYGTEQDSIKQRKLSQRRRNQIRNSVEVTAGNQHSDNLEFKLDETVLYQIPIFEEWFDALMKPFENRLQVTKMNYEYDIKLIEDTVRKNIYLLWNECVNRRCDLAQDFRSTLSQRLYQLQAEFHGDAKFQMLAVEKKRFRLASGKASDPVKRKKLQDSQTLEDIALRSIQSRSKENCTSRPMGSSPDEIASDLQWIRSAQIEDIELERYDELLKNYDGKPQQGKSLEQPKKPEMVMMKVTHPVKPQDHHVKKPETRPNSSAGTQSKQSQKGGGKKLASKKRESDVEGEDIPRRPHKLKVAPQLPSQTAPASLNSIQHLLPSAKTTDAHPQHQRSTPRHIVAPLVPIKPLAPIDISYMNQKPAATVNTGKPAATGNDTAATGTESSSTGAALRVPLLASSQQSGQLSAPKLQTQSGSMNPTAAPVANPVPVISSQPGPVAQINTAVPSTPSQPSDIKPVQLSPIQQQYRQYQQTNPRPGPFNEQQQQQQQSYPPPPQMFPTFPRLPSSFPHPPPPQLQLQHLPPPPPPQYNGMPGTLPPLMNTSNNFPGVIRSFEPICPPQPPQVQPAASANVLQGPPQIQSQQGNPTIEPQGN